MTQKNYYKHPQFQLRIPEDLKALVRESAEKSGRSMNAEIVARLEASFRDNVGLVIPTNLEAEINAVLRSISNYESLLYRLKESGKETSDSFVLYAEREKKKATQKLQDLEDLYQSLSDPSE